MRKIRVMALALIVALALTGAGYAAWSTTITANTKMDIADWSIVLENDATYSYIAGDRVDTFNRTDWSYTKGSSEFGSNDGTGYETGAEKDKNFVYTLAPTPVGTKVNGETACTFEFKNLHPGTQAMTRFEIRNNGTIPGKVEAVRVSLLDKDGNPLYDANGNLIKPDNKNIDDAISAMKVDPIFQLHGSDTDKLINKTDVSLKNLNTELQALVGTVLSPKEYIISSDELEAGVDNYDPVFTFKLPANSLKGAAGENLGLGAQFQVKVEFDFVQYNDVTHSPNTVITD